MAKQIQVDKSKKNISDKDLSEIKALIFEIAKIKNTRHSGKDDMIAILKKIKKQLYKREHDAIEKEKRLSNILDVITSLAKLEYQKKAIVTNKKNYYDALASGIKLLGKKLKSSTI